MSLQYVFALIRKVVEERVDVDVSSGVDQGSCPSFDERIVAFAGLVLGDLLHVRFPIDLRVCRGGKRRGEHVSVGEGRKKISRTDQAYRGP